VRRTRRCRTFSTAASPCLVTRKSTNRWIHRLSAACGVRSLATVDGDDEVRSRREVPLYGAHPDAGPCGDLAHRRFHAMLGVIGRLGRRGPFGDAPHRIERSEPVRRCS
jgi:hypothetical protein